GPAAHNGDILTVVYKGSLEGGKDLPRPKDLPPAAFILGEGQVLPGWDQGLVGVKEGGKRHLVIPPRLAFGEKGAGEIPPNATVTFEVEILKIYPKGAKQAIETKDLKPGKGDTVGKGHEI